ncbi:MAG: YggT family protein [Candidatus Limnocylindria bacterium]
MTYDRRTDPVDPDDPARDDTRVVERETYVERPVAQPYAAPPTGQGQVNVSSQGGPAYAEPAAPGPLYYARRILSLVFGILAVLIGLRILLLLLVANQQNSIVDFVYGVTEPFVAPFRGIFAFDQVTPGGGSTFDIAALVALVGWLLIYLLLMAILRLGDRDRVTTA